MKIKELYLVGQTINEELGLFDIQGVFSTVEKAIEACRGDNFWWFKMRLDEELPIEPIDWTLKIEGIDYDYPTIL